MERKRRSEGVVLRLLNKQGTVDIVQQGLEVWSAWSVTDWLTQTTERLCDSPAVEANRVLLPSYFVTVTGPEQ